jgi:hypothetical protein
MKLAPNPGTGGPNGLAEPVASINLISMLHE